MSAHDNNNNSKLPSLRELFSTNSSSMPWLESRTIFMIVHGSKAYGINNEQSDTDLKGIFIAPKEYYLGFLHRTEQAEFKKGNEDPTKSIEGIVYELQKFVKLAADCNPNIIEVLFTDSSDHLLVTDAGQQLLDKRDLFLSKKVRYTFAGYAHAQLKRIKGHRAWLLNPPKGMPERKDFGLPESKKISKSQLGAMTSVIETGEHDFTDNVMELYHMEQKYQGAKSQWDQYQNWKTNRNPIRAAMEEKHGYDLKHAAHLYRLLKMAEEILTEGKVYVKRPDREEILAIRRGEWSYDQLIEWSTNQEAKMDGFYNASKLPHKAPLKEIDKLAVNILEKAL